MKNRKEATLILAIVFLFLSLFGGKAEAQLMSTDQLASVINGLKTIVESLGETIAQMQGTSQLAQVSGVNSGLVAHYSLDEGSGVLANDFSGNGYTGSLLGSNGLPAWTSGKVGTGALSLDNVDDHVRIQTDVVGAEGGVVTVSAWVKPSTIASGGSIVAKDRSGFLQWNLKMDGQTGNNLRNNLLFGVGAEGTTAYAMADLNWHHVAGVYDGANVYVYIDGVSVDSTPPVLTGTINNFAHSVCIGTSGSQCTENNFFGGLVDDVRIYNRALSSSEIQDLYNYNDSGSQVSSIPLTSDSVAPSIPTNLNIQVVSDSRLDLSWSAATDNVGVVGYRIYRNGSLINSISNTTYSDAGLSSNISYLYTVSSYDAAGNDSGQSSSVSGITQTAIPSDSVLPVVSITYPTENQIVSGTISVTANASDNTGITGVQFKLNNTNLGSEYVASPYSYSWNTTQLSDGNYVLTAVARDLAGNSAVSQTVNVVISNTIADGRVPINLNVTNLFPVNLRLNYSAPLNTSGLSGYRIYRDGVFYQTRAANILYSDIYDLSSNTTYNFTVSATYSDGSESPQSLPLSITTPASISPLLPVSQTSWSFVGVSDSYGGLEGGLAANVSGALRNYSDVRFVISSGDLNTIDVVDRNLQNLRNTYFPNQQYVPFFSVLGNHNAEGGGLDFISNVLGPRLATQLPGMTNFREGPYNSSNNWSGKYTTYSFDYQNAHFILLNQYYGISSNSNPLACMSDLAGNPYLPIWQWLEQDLAQNTKPIIFVIGHEPAFVWEAGINHCGDSLDDRRCPGNADAVMRDKFWKLLRDYNVTAHIDGHIHEFSARVLKGIGDFPVGNYCSVERQVPWATDRATYSSSDGIVEYNNGISHSQGPVNIFRVDGNVVNFSTYQRNRMTGELGLIRSFSYNVSSSSSNVLIQDTTSPFRSGGFPSGSFPSGTTSTTLSLSTNEIAFCRYSTFSTAVWATMIPFVNSGGMSHSTTVTDLQSGSSYTYYVKCSDGSGNVNGDNFTISFSIANTPSVTSTSLGNAIFVDNSLPVALCTNYNVNLRACGSGVSTAYRDLNAASAVVEPGDIVNVRSGTYGRFIPARSGDTNGYITFRAYPGETVTITQTGTIAGLDLNNRHYLIIEGFTIDNIFMWGQVLNSTHNIFRNNKFTNVLDHGSRGSLRFVNSDYNKILNNSFTNGNDSLFFENSNRNLAEGNTFTRARHTELVIACSSYNVIRRNVFHNDLEKNGETFDCEGTIHSLYDDTRQVRRLDSTKHNIWEDNIFQYTPPDDGGGPYNGIQYAGQDGIIRRNIFYGSNGTGLGMAMYSDEALNNRGNRIYHNVFHDNIGGGIETGVSTNSANFSNNIFKNNILYGNRSGVLKWADNRLGGSQINSRSATNYLFINNNIINQNSGEDVIYTAGSIRSLSAVQSRYPDLFSGNTELSPGFENITQHNYHLVSNSQMIDRGAFLATTSSAGSGRTIQVSDARYFYNGFGIAGEVGDTIQLQGQTQTAVITDVNYSTNVITLDRSLSWSNGQGVALAYSGSAPDIGAHEYGLITATDNLLVSTNFSIGEKVEATSNLNVRTTAKVASTLLGVQNIGGRGEVIDGPVYADGFHWWNINYDSGPDGWSVENYLRKYNIQTTSPANSTSSTMPVFQNQGATTGNQSSGGVDQSGDSSTPTYSGSSQGNSAGQIPSISTASPGISQPPLVIPDTVNRAGIKIALFTQPLYPGLYHPEVKELQVFMIKQGYLQSGNDTGYYGKLTRKAVEDFQVRNGIVSGGSAETTGFGLVGAKTRKVINSLLTENGEFSLNDDVIKQAMIDSIQKQIQELTILVQALLIELAELAANQGV